MTALPIDRIRPDPEQPRQSFPAAAIEELAASIRENGLLQPIMARPDPERGEGFYLVVAGERRYRAHLHLGAAVIEARIVDMTPDDVRIAQIVENIARADMTPLEEAMAYQRELDRGLSVEELARKLGMKQAWRISERTCLLRLKPEYRKLFASGNLKNNEAFEMAQLSPSGQDALFEAIRKGLCPDYRALRAVALSLRDREAQGEMFAAPEPTREEREALSRIERRIGQLCRMLADGFDDGELVIVRRVDPNRAATYAEKLSLIRKHVLQMETALRAAAVVTNPITA